MNLVFSELKAFLSELVMTFILLQLRGFEMLKAIHLEPIPFNIERDLITPTFKLKRPQLLKYYKVYSSTSFSTLFL